MALDLGPDPQARLAELLRAAESAHAAYEKSLGHADAEWPIWYARYIIEEAGP